MKLQWILLVCALLGFWKSGFSQDTTVERKLLQVSGIIHNADTSTTVPYVTLTNLSYKNEYFNANHQGFFSFVARSGDTVRLSAVGYHSETLVIPEPRDNNSKNITLSLTMKQQIIDLPVVSVYPWASIDEFNYDFMNLEIADDDILIAKRNLSYETLAAMAEEVPRDAGEIQNISTVNRHIGLTNKAISQRFANPLFSPIAWGNFINQITKGKESRAKNNKR